MIRCCRERIESQAVLTNATHTFSRQMAIKNKGQRFAPTDHWFTHNHQAISLVWINKHLSVKMKISRYHHPCSTQRQSIFKRIAPEACQSWQICQFVFSVKQLYQVEILDLLVSSHIFPRTQTTSLFCLNYQRRLGFLPYWQAEEWKSRDPTSQKTPPE